MNTNNVWLVNVQHHHRQEIVGQAESEHLAVKLLSFDELADTGGPPPLLVVAEAGATSRETLERLSVVRKASQSAPAVIIGRRMDVDHAVAVSRAGATDVVSLPCSGYGHRVLASRREPVDASAASILVGESQVMQQVQRRLSKAAAHNSTVLLTGETGTGKGVAARLVHALSPAAGRAMVHTDCAALSANVIESELFGHERGAFTSAGQRRTGRFEAAGEGSIFLDEIAELDCTLQSKLLRVLQDREFERVGGDQTLTMEARVIVATNRVLSVEVAEGRFRPDLYFRLGVLEIEIPPLRERLDDLTLLVEHGLRELSERLQMVAPTATPEFYEVLREQEWPGNVRELYNVLERAMVSGVESELRGVHASNESIRMPQEPPVAAGDSSDRELAGVLRATGGNVSRAARRLGISRTTLQYRIRKRGLEGLIPRD